MDDALAAFGLRRADLRRVNVVGTSGSGKSHFSRELATRLNSVHVQLDELYWGPGWQPASDEAFMARVQEKTIAEHWVIDGNYSRSEPVKWRRATAIIWLDYAFHVTLWRAIRRAVKRAATQEELWPGTGNRESFRKLLFHHDSIVLWTLHSFHRVRRKYSRIMEDPSLAHIRRVRLNHSRQAQQLLDAAAAASPDRQQGGAFAASDLSAEARQP